MEEDLTDPWDDITGSKEKPKKMSLVPTQKGWHQHEHEQITTQRRARCLEAIFSVMPDAKYDETRVRVTAEAAGKKFDFYAASDCYYIHSTQRYGHGIEKLCAQIMRRLLKDEKKP